MTVHVRGDFNTTSSTYEAFDVLLDGYQIGTHIDYDSPGTFDHTQYSYDDREFSWSFDINPLAMGVLMGDGTAIVEVLFGSGVGLNMATAFSEVTLSYNTTVPVPAAIWLFGSGLLGLVGYQRHSKA